MKQGLEDANAKLNALVDRLSPPTTMQGSVTGLGTIQVALSAPSNSGSIQPVPSVVTASTRCPLTHPNPMNLPGLRPPSIPFQLRHPLSLSPMFAIIQLA